MAKPLHWIILTLVFVAAAWIILKTGSSEARIEERLDLNWRFTQADDTAFSASSFDDSGWDIISIPHDWMISGEVDSSNMSGTAGGFYPGGIAWYRKQFDLSAYPGKKHFYLVFDGVYMNADIWLNGKPLGSHSYGYIGFEFDITEHIHPDTVNVLAIRTDCSNMPVDRWYSGAGIFRHVKLIATENIHFPDRSLLLQTQKVNDSEFTVFTEHLIKNGFRKNKRIKIRYDLLSPDGTLIQSKITTRTLSGSKTERIREAFTVENPNLWSPETPSLYHLNTFIIQNRTIVDNVESDFGIRTAEFSPDSGFILNGRKRWLKGVCLHHDGGAMGAAVPKGTWEYRLNILKSLGVNALRLAHNPHAPELLDLCDRMGFLVINEMYDRWELQWDGGEPGFDFEETFEEDLTYFVRRDMYRPSVIAWSVGNETVEQLKNPELGRQWYQRLINTVKKSDTTRMVTCGLHPGWEADDVELPSSYIHVSPLVSYNYRTDSFSKWHQQYPDKIWLASETKRYNETRPQDFMEISYLDNSWFDMDTFVAGQFIWAGIDYLGESMGWPDKAIRSGLLETSNRVKPGAYFTQSIYSAEPMVKIAVVDKALADSLNNQDSWQAPWFDAPVVRHWNFSEGEEKLQLVVYTNCAEVELTLNGGPVGKKQKKNFADGVIKTRVSYNPGMITAIAPYIDKNGNTAYVSDTLATAGSPVKIIMEPDKSTLRPNGYDVVHINTRVVDEKGITAPEAQNMIRYRIEGPGKLKMIDNGNPADHTPHPTQEKRVHNGEHLLVVQATHQPGDLIIQATAEGLESARIKLKSEEK